MPPTCLRLGEDVELVSSAPRKPAFPPVEGTALAEDFRPAYGKNGHSHAEHLRLVGNVDAYATNGTDVSANSYVVDTQNNMMLDTQQVMQALQVVLNQVNANLKFTKALYRGTKKSLVGPGFESTRLNTNDSIFGTNSIGPIVSQENSNSSNQSGLYVARLQRQASPTTVPAYISEKSDSSAQGSKLFPIDEKSGAEGCSSSACERRPSITSTMRRQSSLSQVSEMVSKKEDFRKQFRVRIWRFLEDRNSSFAALYYVRCRNLFIVLSILAACSEAFEDSVLLSNKGAGLPMTLAQISTESLFALEFILRFCSCPKKAVFFLSAHNQIDLVSAFPCFLRVIILAKQGDHTELVSVLGIVPVLRALKLLRHFDTFHLLLDAFCSAAEAMPMILFTMFLIASGFAALIFFVEPRSNIPSFPASLYLSIITVSTVGYGDFHPSTDPGRVLAAVLAIIGPMYMSIPIWIIGRAFSDIWEDRHRLLILLRMRRCVANAGYSPTELKHMFKLLDQNGDGSLDWKEFTLWIQAMDLMDLRVTDDFIQQVFESFDADDEGSVNFEELLRGLFPRTYHRVRQLANGNSESEPACREEHRVI